MCLADNIPNARLIVIPGVAHGLFWQAPDVVDGHIGAWLDSQ